jgi:hypothetical protein
MLDILVWLVFVAIVTLVFSNKENRINILQDENSKLIEEIEILRKISGSCAMETTNSICSNCNCYMKYSKYV